MRWLGVLVTVGVLALAGCAASGEPDAGGIRVVASTDVYGQLVEEIGGDAVAVTSIVHSVAQDPHSYEPGARDRLAVARADLLVVNGGGYDAFVDALIAADGSTAPVVTAVDDAPGDTDEHVWYDPATMNLVAARIAAALAALDPDRAADFTARAATFSAGIGDLEQRIGALAAAHGGTAVLATEPVPGHLLRAAALDDRAPAAFTEAVEEGNDVPPAVLLDVLRLLDGDGAVAAVVVNTQTGGAETERVVADAEARGIPVVRFSETLPAGETYLSWMSANVAALAAALAV